MIDLPRLIRSVVSIVWTTAKCLALHYGLFLMM